MRAAEMRELRKLAELMGKWARQIDLRQQHEMIGPYPPAPAGLSSMIPLGEQYSYIVCKRCQSPAILLRDRGNMACGLAVCCLDCREISPLPEGLKNFRLE